MMQQQQQRQKVWACAGDDAAGPAVRVSGLTAALQTRPLCCSAATLLSGKATLTLPTSMKEVRARTERAMVLQYGLKHEI